MSRFEKLIIKLLSANADQNFDFADLIRILEATGFSVRIKGSHHIFSKENIEEIINIQEIQGKAKPYQIKQVRNLILRYQLKLEDNEN